MSDSSVTKLTKKELASKLGMSVSSLYYHHKKPATDLEVKYQIEAVQTHNPAYGHKRIAMALKLNKKRILRVMKKFNIKPFRRRLKLPVKKHDLNKSPTVHKNMIKDLNIDKPDIVWATDFTYIKFHDKFIYLATIMDLYTREITGFNISRFHNSELICGALHDALKYTNGIVPTYIHSDQGSEYDSQAYTIFADKLNVKISMSTKASPWENGYQESWYSTFKLELGDANRFDELGELIEAIYQQIWYHNNMRIHTALKTYPCRYRDLYYEKLGT